MEALERTTVQLHEARRLAAYDDVPHGRLALLLLDNAAETMLMRSVDHELWWADVCGRLLRQVRSWNADGEKAKSLESELEAKALSKSARRRIEREFGYLVDYAFNREQCTLAPEFATCIKVLHHYRNAAYHQDTVRSDVLGPAVQIYFYLCCHLLKDYSPSMSVMDVPSPGVVEIFEGEPLPAMSLRGHFSSKELGVMVADRLLKQMDLDHAHIASALSAHLTARLSALDDHLDEITGFIAPPSTRTIMLRLVQLAPDDPEQDSPLDDFWTRQLPVTEDTLNTWKAEAREIGDISIALDALGAFATIEGPLSQLEKPVQRFIAEIDREVQSQIDEARGK
jgi:hypothetical protein